MIFEEGLSRCGRVVDGYRVGWIVDVERDRFAVSWLHETTPVWYPRPEDDENNC